MILALAQEGVHAPYPLLCHMVLGAPPP